MYFIDSSLYAPLFCYGQLASQIPKQTPWVWFGWFHIVVHQFGMIHSEIDNFIFNHNSSQGCINLIVYVDDTVITCSDQHGIINLKQYLSRQFQGDDLGKLEYFLGIEVAESNGYSYVS